MNNTIIDPEERNVYLVGGGIASLSSAVYFIQEGHVPGKNIHIFEQLSVCGGSLDASGDAEIGFMSRGSRMFDMEAYDCTYDLLSRVPSAYHKNMTALDEFNKFNKETKFNRASLRLVGKDAEKIDVLSFELSRGDRLALTNMMLQPESKLGKARVSDCFSEEFFHTNYWYMWATSFAFQPWHSAVEFKRYLHRFLHEFPHVTDMAGVRHSEYNQYDSIVVPIVKYLEDQGVNFNNNCEVTNLDIETVNDMKVVKKIYLNRNGKDETIAMDEKDLVLVTIGSMTAASSIGEMHKAGTVNRKDTDGAWKLWENIAKGNPEFGNPSVFDNRIDESLWQSFTITFKNDLFFKLMDEFCKGTGTEITFKDSNWFTSIVLPMQPHFKNQPEGVQVAWGYSLHPDAEGNFIKKKMYDCTGEEILREICYLLQFNDEVEDIIKSANCRTCIMPFITSQFLTRTKGDRPDVVPETSKNLAFIGQFCEIPDDVVFTVDYSVRSSQMAVYKLLGLDYKVVTPIFKGENDIKILLGALATMLK